MPQIVYIDVSQTATEAPSDLQQKGAIVSLGGTTLETGSYQLLTSVADLTAISPTASGTAATIAASADVFNAATAFFAQGTGSVYVLELGAASSVGPVLNPYIVANPQQFYAYLLPTGSYSDDAFQTMTANYNAASSMVYFFVNGPTTGYSAFSGNKCVNYNVPYSGAGSTENLAAASLYNFINATPGTAKKLAPFAFRYLYANTQWPEAGNAATFKTLRAANVNIAGSGSVGGISNVLLYWGYFMDGKPMSYWYAVDWAQINLARDLSYETIIGSNSDSAPLIYDQRGITRLQARAATTLNTGTSYGVIVGQASVSAVDFATYVSQNTGDYASGTYNGLSATITPIRGFEQITFYLNVDFSGTAVVSDTTDSGS